MPPRYELSIVAPDHSVFEGRVQGLIAPGAEGYFGVLARHAPMVVELRTGELTVVNERGEREHFAVSGGFLEVSREGVTVVVDAAESVSEIDMERAEAAEKRARRRLELGDDEVDVARAETALRRALNRKMIVSKRRSAR